MSLIDLTLADQLQITAFDLEERKAAFQIDDRDLKVLASFQSVIAGEADDLARRICEQICQCSDVVLAIGDKGTMLRVQNAFKEYLLRLFNGFCDGPYVDSHLRTGLIHQRIGVGPKQFLSAVNTISCLLDELLDKRGERLIGAEAAVLLRSSMHKMIRFDVHLVFEGYMSALNAHVENANAKMRTYTQQLEAEVSARTHELETIAQHDGLTGLLNRRAFFERLRHEISVAKQAKKPVCLASIDLNGFKEINDARGHQAGDEILAYVGRTLAASVRDTDIPVRQGGDEFAVILPNTEIRVAKEVCERLRGIFAEAIGYPVTFSMGVAQCGPTSFPSEQALIECADELMYKAKAVSRQSQSIQVEYESPNLKAI
ncbi:MAG: GGDEF domain-containing protein [Planctomycetes bacterium]|nr:GGDEF domain-containing protein [Planctomycetota bacterium]MCP4862197.1 GGDEF domain-containing protein [Planctomycetota bacterium]